MSNFDAFATDPLPSRSAKLRLVVAEDDPVLRDFLCDLLAPFYEVEAAADGEAAWIAVQRTAPALLLTDLQMPILDGLGLIRRVRAQPRLALVPIILLTACNDEELPLLGAATGANDILLKPFRCAELLACLQAAITTRPTTNAALCRWKKRKLPFCCPLLAPTPSSPARESTYFRTNPAHPGG